MIFVRICRYERLCGKNIKTMRVIVVVDGEELRTKAARGGPYKKIGLHVLSQSPFPLVQRPQQSKESSPDRKSIDKTCLERALLFCSVSGFC